MLKTNLFRIVFFVFVVICSYCTAYARIEHYGFNEKCVMADIIVVGTSNKTSSSLFGKKSTIFSIEQFVKGHKDIEKIKIKHGDYFFLFPEDQTNFIDNTRYVLFLYDDIGEKTLVGKDSGYYMINSKNEVDHMGLMINVDEFISKILDVISPPQNNQTD